MNMLDRYIIKVSQMEGYRTNARRDIRRTKWFYKRMYSYAYARFPNRTGERQREDYMENTMRSFYDMISKEHQE